MMSEPTKFSEAWNFGPEAENVCNVESLVQMLINNYGKGSWRDLSDSTGPHEAKLLSLDINKAKYELHWKPVLNIQETIELTIEWYKQYSTENVLNICQNQINTYTRDEPRHKQHWGRS